MKDPNEMDEDDIREGMLRFIVKQDMDRHRGIYDGLADEQLSGAGRTFRHRDGQSGA